MLVLTFLGVSVVSLFNVVESRVWFLTVENFFFICTLNVVGFNCAKCFSLVPVSKEIGKDEFV